MSLNLKTKTGKHLFRVKCSNCEDENQCKIYQSYNDHRIYCHNCAIKVGKESDFFKRMCLYCANNDTVYYTDNSHIYCVNCTSRITGNNEILKGTTNFNNITQNYDNENFVY